jgi:CRISPR-associated protein (TIGR02710 family)
LFLNAQRRREEGKYDDAVARLYRLIEMAGQAALMDRGVDTGNVEPDRLPDSLRAEYAARRSPDTGKIVLGLQEDYRILAAFGNPLGEAFLENKRLRDLLAARNLSILAHGRAPVGRERCEALAAEARGILAQRVRDLDKTLQGGTFARLALR